MSVFLRDHPTMSLRQLSVLALGLVAVVTVHARTTGPAPPAVNDIRAKSDVAGYLADIRFMYKLYEECRSQEFSPCLKKKVIVALDRAGKSTKYLSLMDGVRFVKDPNVEPKESVTEKDLETILQEARSLDDPDSILNQMILDKIINFFTSHTLEFKLFEKSANGRSYSEGRRRRFSSLLMVPLLLAGTLIPLAFGALALLAGKALIVSKLALALAAIIGLRRLVGSGGGGESYQVVTVPHHSTGHYKRSMEDAHQLAYVGYVPATLGAAPAPISASSRVDQLQGIRR